MKVYVILLQDRHCDAEIQVFTSPYEAMGRVNVILDDYDYTEEQEIEGWIYFAYLDGDESYIRVTEEEVQ